MKITIVLCTYNRCQILGKALESLAASQVPSSVEWEGLVVDNNSQDRTREVVEDFCSRYPGRFRYLFEPRPGKSYALNTGIREAQGDVLAFVDDDVTVETAWLQNLTGSLGDEQWSGTGGRILPAWNCPPPRWIPVGKRYGLAPLAMFDLGPDAGPLTEPPFGANMAFRRKVFEKYHGFRTDLGPRPGSEIRNEDTEFGRRLLVAGERLRYEPAAVVHHHVSENRLRKAYFLAWWFGKGRADAREFQNNSPYLLCSFVAWTLRWIITVDGPLRFQRKLIVWEKAGAIVEWCRILFSVKKKEERNAEA